MASVLTALSTVFGGSGAFIFIERQPRGVPLFHIVRASDIQTARTRPVPHRPSSSVLVITEHVYSHPDHLSGRLIYA
ncbi:hypothetical protein C8R48DRAFT_689355 [Suillus tomentosus]|nr:hypothetical protein C8R48DRAFT_689355 [Suillus tomentosus]